VLWNDPATGVMRHADAGYDDARAAGVICLRARAGAEPADGEVATARPGADALLGVPPSPQLTLGELQAHPRRPGASRW
jgi:hypothetical protein